MTGAATWHLGLADVLGAVRRRWLAAVALAGLLGCAATGLVAAGRTGQSRVDALHTGTVTVFLIGGLILAVGLGATAFSRDAESGFLGLAHVASASRTVLAVSRLLARLACLGAVLAAWWLALQVAGLALGTGWDGPLAVHGLAATENLGLVLLICAAANTVVGPASSAVAGLGVHVAAQAFANVKSAVDVGLITSSWRVASRVLYAALPRIVESPLFADLANRGAGGPAARRFEINGTLVPVVGAGWTTVLVTLAWCAAFAALAVRGMRARSL